MQGARHATRAAVATPSDTTDHKKTLGFYVGGADQAEEGAITIAWLDSAGTASITCLFRVPVGVTIPIAGFRRVMSTGTTLPTTNGQVVVFYE